MCKRVCFKRQESKYTNLVQFEEDARGGFVVTVLVLLRALPPRRHVHVAYFAGGRWFTVVANRPFLGTVRRRGWFLILCNVFKTLFISQRSSSNIIYRENMEWLEIEIISFILFQESCAKKNVISIFKIALNFIRVCVYIYVYIMYSYYII